MAGAVAVPRGRGSRAEVDGGGIDRGVKEGRRERPESTRPVQRGHRAVKGRAGRIRGGVWG